MALAALLALEVAARDPEVCSSPNAWLARWLALVVQGKIFSILQIMHKLFLHETDVLPPLCLRVSA